MWFHTSRSLWLSTEYILSSILSLVYCELYNFYDMSIYEITALTVCVFVPVSRPCSMTKLRGGGFPTLDSGYSSPRLRVHGDHYLSPTTRYSLQ